MLIQTDQRVAIVNKFITILPDEGLFRQAHQMERAAIENAQVAAFAAQVANDHRAGPIGGAAIGQSQGRVVIRIGYQQHRRIDHELPAVLGEVA